MSKSPAQEFIPEFLKTYDAEAMDKLWKEQSAKFRQFWSERVMASGLTPISDEDCDTVIRILDRNGKGNTKESEAVAKAMIAQGAWRRIFNDCRSDKDLAQLIDSILKEESADQKATLIDELYQQNNGRKNHLTGQSGNMLNAFLAAYDPISNLSIVSLNDRKALVDYLAVPLPFEWTTASAGKRIVQSNILLRQAFENLGIAGSARTQSRFCYFEPIKDLWRNHHASKLSENNAAVPASSDSKNQFNTGLELNESAEESATRQYWTLSAGEGGEMWEEFYKNGIAAIGWDDLGDLSLFKTKSEIRQRLIQLWPSDSNPRNNAHACWQFVYELEPGDIIFAKQGFTQILGYGIVEGDYQFDPTRSQYKHHRKVKWLAKGEWQMPSGKKVPMKTLTDITPYGDIVAILSKLVGLELDALPEPSAIAPVVAVIPFTKADALVDLFMSAAELDVILARLKRKKALILQGPPGVGKTFIARRLAYALMGKRDDRRVALVQFHPSYGYEDFVQGFRPTRNGLERRDGVFHQFARLARNDPDRDWFFIIDEINRGNLAKIFGELLMLIEADKRGPDHAIPLTYSKGPEEAFHLPANLHFIGTMNTADRSLAMVDYALRRRFTFVTLDPALASPAFATWLKQRNASDAMIARIRTKVETLNGVIETERDLGPGFRIGHSFFCPPPDQVPDEAWYREVIAGEIQPLLEEYFDSRERVDKLVAELLA
jgi:hypothetical protein